MSITTRGKRKRVDEYDYDQGINEIKKRMNKDLKEKIILDSNFIACIYDFVKKDEYCNKYSDFIKTRVFQLGWTIKVKNKYVLKIFEYPVMKGKFQNFLYNCRNFIRIFGFCIYYVTTDIEKWLEKYNSLSDYDKNEFKLPFGFVNVNDVDIYSETENGKFESVLKIYPKINKLNRKYNFFVYYYDYVEDTLRLNTSSYSDYNRQNYSFVNSNHSGISMIRPFSKFTVLREKKLKLIEAIHSRSNANFMACHPETWIIPEPLKEISTENLSEGNLYTFDDLEDARSTTNQRYSRLSLQFAQDTLRKVQGSSYPQRPPDINNRDKLKKAFNHVDLKDGLQIIPSESSKIYKSHDPKSLIDIQMEIDDYNELTASLFKLPKSILSIQDIKKTQRLNTSVQGSYIKLIEKEIEFEQKIINDIFVSIYSNSFGIIENTIGEFVKDPESTQIVFEESQLITDDQIPILIQLHERQLISTEKLSNIIDKWI
jgi:hypothetical protein